MAKTRRIKRELDVENGTMSFTEIATGEKLVCKLEDVFPGFAELGDIQKRLVGHAVNAKVGDSAADPDKPVISTLSDVWAALVGGTWSTRGDGSGPRISDVVTAMFNLAKKAGKDITLEQVADWYSELSKEDKAEYRKRPNVRLEVEAIKAERAKARHAELKRAARSEDFELPF